MDVEKLIAAIDDEMVGVEPGYADEREYSASLRALTARAEKAEAERDEAREALRPFAEASRDCDDDLVSDGCSAWESSEANCVTIGHFRAASRALGGGE